MTRNSDYEARITALETLLETMLVPLWKISLPEEERERQIDSLTVTIRTSGDRNTDDPLRAKTAEELRRWVGILREGLKQDT